MLRPRNVALAREPGEAVSGRIVATASRLRTRSTCCSFVFGTYLMQEYGKSGGAQARCPW
jgi:hypothetical protein